jgi:virginiamycin B lyase
VFFASLAGSYLGRIDVNTGTTTILEPPVPRQGARRVWSDSSGTLWITGWNSGDLFHYDSKNNSWRRWHLPGDRPQPYAVYVPCGSPSAPRLDLHLGHLMRTLGMPKTVEP